MHKIFILYKEGKIKPVVDSVFTFEDVEQKKNTIFFLQNFIFQVNNALGKLIDRENIGNVVIEPFLNTKPEKVKKVEEKKNVVFLLLINYILFYQLKANTSHGRIDDGHSSSTSGPDDDNDDKDPEDFQNISSSSNP